MGMECTTPEHHTEEESSTSNCTFLSYLVYLLHSANVSTPAPSDSSIPSPQIYLFSDDGTRYFTSRTPTRHPKHTRDCNLFQAAPIDAFTDEYQRSPGTTFLPSCCAIIGTTPSKTTIRILLCLNVRYMYLLCWCFLLHIYLFFR